MFFRQIGVGEHAVFSYLIGDPDIGEAIVVDPADDVDMLISVARDEGMTIRTILNTHGHVDHVMGNFEMKQKTGAEIVIHEAEAEYLTRIGEVWLRMFGAKRSPPADRTVRDGDILRVGRWRGRPEGKSCRRGRRLSRKGGRPVSLRLGLPGVSGQHVGLRPPSLR